MPRFFTPAEVAKMVRIGHNTILNWIKSGQLEAVKMGRNYRIKESVVRKLLDLDENEPLVFPETTPVTEASQA